VIVFVDPQQRPAGVFASKSENPSGTQNQEILDPILAATAAPDSPLERALQRFGAVIQARLLAKERNGIVEAV
jgi:hypothetical protein